MFMPEVYKDFYLATLHKEIRKDDKNNCIPTGKS